MLDRGGQSSKLGTRSERVGSERSKEIVYYYCGCPPQSALILTLIEGFEMASNNLTELIFPIEPPTLSVVSAA